MTKNKQNELVFSGVQPSASQVHIGNYLGAMRRFVTLAKEYPTVFCLVDLHALTTIAENKDLNSHTMSLAAAYLAIGIDPKETILFRQSDVPEVCELSWYLSCLFPIGLLERAHAYKDAKAKNLPFNCGSMYYPILMAADVLLYRGTRVPVGADQKQHLEMMREVAQKFNQRFGDFFPVPEPLIDENTGIIPGLDGRKMSKSYDNYIGLFEDPKAVKKKIGRIVTDSKGVDEKKDPDTCNIFSLYKFFATKDEQAELRERYLAGGMGYAHAKEQLFNVVDREIAPLRSRYQEIASKPDQLTDILSDGANRARDLARKTIDGVRVSMGVGRML